MSVLLKDISDQAQIVCGDRFLDAKAIKDEVASLSHRLKSIGVKNVGIFLDNGPEWLLVNLACLISNITITPIPPFFSAEMKAHIISTAKIDCIVTHLPDLGSTLLPSSQEIQLSEFLYASYRDNISSLQGDFHGCITFTSGTTGAPKGVLLPYEVVLKKIKSLYDHISPDYFIGHLVITPLPILLENILALVPLFKGGAVFVNSSSLFIDSQTFMLKCEPFLNYIQESKVTTFFLSPLFLENLMDFLEKNKIKLSNNVRFIGVGGAFTPVPLLEAAQRLNMPIYQGYGLSENCAVFSLNTPCANKIGSVGKILPESDIKIDEDGLIRVKGTLFSGYIGGPSVDQEHFYDTGDLGYIQDDYLYITGRKRNVQILQNGRNISPEWIAQEVLKLQGIHHVVVIGEARPFVTVIISPKTSFDKSTFSLDLKKLNETLPFYAQVLNFMTADSPFTIKNGFLDAKNQPNTKAILEYYKKDVEKMYCP